VIQVDINNDRTVLDLKRVISDENGVNVDKMVLMADGEELHDQDTLMKCGVKDGDILFVVILVLDNEPPYKGKRWIKLSGHKLDTDVKFHTKLFNPAMFFITNNFEGSVNDEKFRNLNKDFVNSRLNRFMRDLEEVGQQLTYVYFGGAYFIATNEDTSIVYYYDPEQTKIYIRGYFIQYSLWESLTVEERREIIEQDSSLKNVIMHSWDYIRRKGIQEKERKQQEKLVKKSKRLSKLPVSRSRASSSRRVKRSSSVKRRKSKK